MTHPQGKAYREEKSLVNVQTYMYNNLMNTLTFTEAREKFTKTISTVIDDRVPVRVTNKRRGSVIIMPEAEFNSWQETIYLLKSPANAARLMEGIDALGKGCGRAFENIEAIEQVCEEKR